MKRLAILMLAMTLFACNSTKVKQETTNRDTREQQPEQVYFKSIGTEPFWAIEISARQIKYTTPENTEGIVFGGVEPVRVMDANIKSYHSRSKSGEIKITITQGKCSDGMSDQEHNYAVKVALKLTGDKDFKNLQGCGNYIVDYRLHDIWVLEEMEGQKVADSDFNTRPNIEINAAEARFSGSAGCNRVFGKLFSERNLLRFTGIGTTRMLCDKISNEAKFLKALESATGYEIKNNRLYLSNPDGIKLVFKKVD